MLEQGQPTRQALGAAFITGSLGNSHVFIYQVICMPERMQVVFSVSNIKKRYFLGHPVIM
jgi:hypothetical protein